MTGTADMLLESVFETMGRAVREDLDAESERATRTAYVSRLGTLSRLTTALSSSLVVDADDGMWERDVADICGALDAIGAVTDARFWEAVAEASERDLVRISLALFGRARNGQGRERADEIGPLAIALEVLSNPDVRDLAATTKGG